jgi:hypothetical protein
LITPTPANDYKRNSPRALYGTIRQLPDSDPRNLNHSYHRENWLALARVIGEALADEDHERDLMKRGNHEEVNNDQGGDLRKVLH